jgi:hypothetical protein
MEEKMPFARHYETFEVRQLMQTAEGAASPVTGVGAHSRTLHAQRTPGGVGVVEADMVYRTHKGVGESNNAFKNRGGAVQTSAFANLLQQADAACQALNSNTGNRALQVFDLPLHAGKNLRMTLEVAGIREAGFMPGSGPQHMATIHKSQAAVNRPNAAGVRLIIDRAPGQANIHIQTCFPLDALGGSRFEVKDLGTNATVAVG